MLWRLNHELLPDPGNPIASTTVPLLGRAAVGASRGRASVGNEATAGIVATAAFPTDDSAATGSAAAGSVADSFAATSGAGGEPAVFERERPRPPRLRRRRETRATGTGSAAGDFSTTVATG